MLAFWSMYVWMHISLICTMYAFYVYTHTRMMLYAYDVCIWHMRNAQTLSMNIYRTPAISDGFHGRVSCRCQRDSWGSLSNAMGIELLWTPTEFVKPGIYRTPKVPLQAWTHTIIQKNWGYLNFQVNTPTYISTWFCWTESWLNAIFFERLLLGLWSCDHRFVCQETLACPDAAFSIQRSTSNAMRASWFAITSAAFCIISPAFSMINTSTQY